MMFLFRTYLFFSLCFCFVSCKPDQEKQKLLSSLDSLNGSLTVLCNLMNTYDSVSVKNALETYEAYRVFIKYRTEDTLNAEDAQNIKKFFQSAQQIEAFRVNKATVLQRCVLLRTQINNLKQDVQNDLYGTDQTKQFFQRELEAGKDIDLQIFSQRKALENALKDFIETRIVVEAYLRSKNEGKLPLTVSVHSTL